MVRVRLFGRLRDLIGVPETELEVRGRTLGDLVEELAARFGEKIKEELIGDDDRVDYAYALFRCGERVWELSSPIDDGDEITITSMLAGGSIEQDRPC